MPNSVSLYPYQSDTVEFVRARRHSIIAHQPGLGKTACAIVAADLPALVICPASLVPNWRREIDLWRPESAHLFSVLSYSDRSLGVLSPGNTARLFRTLIADEAHYLKSRGANRTERVCDLIRAVDKSIALSGTILPNRPIELWPLLHATGITDKAFYPFARRYADSWKAPWGIDVSGSSNESELRALLEPHLIRYSKAQVLPHLPPKTWNVIALDLPRPRQERRFSLDELSALDESIAFEALSDVLRLWGERKTPRAVEFITSALESEAKLVVFAHHREVVGNLAAALAEFNPVTILGGTTPAAKQRAVDAFQTDPECRVIVGQNVAMGVGHTLTAASHVVIVEGSWVPGDLEQMGDRCHRIGQRDNVTVDVLTISGSIDEAMLRRALEKQAVIDQIIVDTPRE